MAEGGWSWVIQRLRNADEIKTPGTTVREPGAPHRGYRAILEEISRDTLISVYSAGQMWLKWAIRNEK
jgi:hypothetical protein